ncbi:MAG: hypothetical protein IH614_06805, partial [Desulfuromonadales bacterium]|nr:hypothetical protein [Desulfuromonadales bacterium]
MNRSRWILWAMALALAGCQASGDKETIAKLRYMKIDIQEETLEGGLEKAIESYRHFLEVTPESALTPEAIRRLADLKVEKEYGQFTGGGGIAGRPSASLSPPPRPVAVSPLLAGDLPASSGQAAAAESQADFERRATEPAVAGGGDGAAEG